MNICNTCYIHEEDNNKSPESNEQFHEKALQYNLLQEENHAHRHESYDNLNIPETFLSIPRFISK